MFISLHIVSIIPSYKGIFIRFFGGIGYGSRASGSDFSDNADQNLDPRFLNTGSGSESRNFLLSSAADKSLRQGHFQ